MAASQASHVTRHASRITHHASRITREPSSLSSPLPLQIQPKRPFARHWHFYPHNHRELRGKANIVGHWQVGGEAMSRLVFLLAPAGSSRWGGGGGGKDGDC